MNSLITYLLQITTVFSVLYLLYMLILSKLTFHKANRIILLLIIPISIILPFSGSLFPSLSSEIINISLFDSEPFSTEPFDTETFDNIDNEPLQVTESHLITSSVNYIKLLTIIYVLILSIYLIRIFITARRFFLLKNKSLILEEKGYKLVVSSVSEIFSFFKWIFIPKHRYKNLNPQILDHEKAHIKLNHSWDLMITELFIALFWFNPLLNFYRKSLKSVHEFQADETVLKNGVKVSQYMQLLMQSIEVKKPNNLYHYFNQPILKKRVTMMTKPKSNHFSKLTYILILPFCALLISAFNKPIDEQNIVPGILKVLEPKSTSPSLLFPIQNVSKENITAYFGEERKHPKVNQGIIHTGIDIRANLGTPVLATADGVIAKASMEGDWGNLIVITHMDGYETWYAHLKGFNTGKNQEVKKGDIIGYVGNTGKSTGPHLHYEVKQNGKRLNPLNFKNSNKKTIVIDVSHGGQDNGVSIGNLNEKEITLNIAKKIKELNENDNVEIILTRDSDKFLTLNERTENINALKPDFVISLHVNSNEDRSQNGMEIFVSNKNKQKDKSTKLALDLLNSFDKHHTEIKNADLYLLKNVNYPIALVELGYLTNENDRELLTSENGQLELVTSILNAIK